MRGFAGQADVSKLDRDYIVSADYLHLDGFHYDAALQAAMWMREAGKTVVYDGGKTNGRVPERTAELIRYVDVLICGSGFATALTGVEGIWEAGEAALKYGPRIVVQTEGEDGSYTTTADGERFHVPAFEIDVLDTTGAGDVFHGAYIVGMLHGWNLEAVAQFSSAVSALKCTQVGRPGGNPHVRSDSGLPGRARHHAECLRRDVHAASVGSRRIGQGAGGALRAAVL